MMFWAYMDSDRADKRIRIAWQAYVDADPVFRLSTTVRESLARYWQELFRWVPRKVRELLTGTF